MRPLDDSNTRLQHFDGLYFVSYAHGLKASYDVRGGVNGIKALFPDLLDFFVRQNVYCDLATNITPVDVNKTFIWRMYPFLPVLLPAHL